MAEELESPILDGIQLARKPNRPLPHGAGVAAANLFAPSGPGCSVVYVLQGHEEREVIEPGTGAFTKVVEGRAIRARHISKESLCCPAQHWSLELNRRPKIDRVLWKGRRLSQSDSRSSP